MLIAAPTPSRNTSDDHPLYIDADTEESINYGDFRKLVRQAAFGFSNIGMKKGDSLCLYTPNNISVPSVVLASLASGGNICPANPLFTKFELQKMLTVSKSKYIIAHPINIVTALEAAEATGIPKSNVWSICVDPGNRVPDWRSMVIRGPEESDPIKLTVEESKSTLAYLCFSSGTTGQPKGVMISHHNFIANSIELTKSLENSSLKGKEGSLLGVVPLFHILGIFRFIHLAVYEGRTTVLMARYDLEKFCQSVEKYKITSLYVVPPMLLQLVNSPSIVDKYDFSSVVGFHAGAAPVSSGLSNQINKKFNIPVLQGYGMTETASVLTYQTIETYIPGSVGRMISGIDAIVTDENGRVLPSGERGEICIKGPIVMQGYLNNPEATAEVIDKNGYLHTGDIGYFDKLGNWYIVDRSKELIKYNAFQIAPAELESVLIECPLVSDAAVIGIYDKKRDTEVPRAYLSLSSLGKNLDSTKASSEIHKFVNEKVSEYKRLRGGIEFIEVVPKSVSGKILRKDLRELYKNQTVQNCAKL
ncbi:hypothetical protein MFLAVUS_003862 [Mucor flavus]|uniref:Uncharacterized protein n=1 Tax=Mucor flavus TaxID=439312 RepID=A0ABP9YUC3_9FUNG